jgi:hypothetical protein
MSYMEKRPDTLQSMITQAILINNQLYKRLLERKGHYQTGNEKRGRH